MTSTLPIQHGEHHSTTLLGSFSSLRRAKSTKILLRSFARSPWSTKELFVFLGLIRLRNFFRPPLTLVTNPILSWLKMVEFTIILKLTSRTLIPWRNSSMGNIWILKSNGISKESSIKPSWLAMHMHAATSRSSIIITWMNTLLIGTANSIQERRLTKQPFSTTCTGASSISYASSYS